MVHYVSTVYILKHIYWVSVPRSGREIYPHRVSYIFCIFALHFAHALNTTGARIFWCALLSPSWYIFAMVECSPGKRLANALFDSYFYIYLAVRPNYYLILASWFQNGWQCAMFIFTKHNTSLRFLRMKMEVSDIINISLHVLEIVLLISILLLCIILYKTSRNFWDYGIGFMGTRFWIGEYENEIN